MNDMENKYATGDLADMLGVEPVTIRKYALALEKYGYIVDRSDGKNRTFSERDVTVFRQLITLRERSGVNVDTAAQLVASKHSTDTVKDVSIVRNDDIEFSDRYDPRYDELTEKIGKLMEIAQQQVAEMAALPSLEQQRMDRLNDRLTERRVERKLEAEALKLWSAKPEAERMMKVGLFRKAENLDARNRFVRDYVDEHYEDRMRGEYGNGINE